MLKLILVAFLITGYSCTDYRYHKKAVQKYIKKTITEKHAFPETLGVLNADPQEFHVTRVDNDIIFEAANKDTAFSIQSKHGLLVLSKFKISFGEPGIEIILQFNMDHEYLKQLYIHSNVYANPSKEELKEHAKTNAMYLEPLTEQNAKQLTAKTDTEMRKITLNVQWIQDLLNNERKPLYSPYFSQSLFVYLSPPTLMNYNVLMSLYFLTNQMISSPVVDEWVLPEGEDMVISTSMSMD